MLGQEVVLDSDKVRNPLEDIAWGIGTHLRKAGRQKLNLLKRYTLGRLSVLQSADLDIG